MAPERPKVPLPPSPPDEIILEQAKKLPRVTLWRKIKRVFFHEPNNPGVAPESPPPIGQTSFQRKLPLK